MQVKADLSGRYPIVDHRFDLFACFPYCSWMRNNSWLMHLMLNVRLTPPPIRLNNDQGYLIRLNHHVHVSLWCYLPFASEDSKHQENESLH
jgi:hypothetical protein